MKIGISAMILSLALAAGVFAQTANNSQLNSITRDQRGVDARVDELTKTYQALLVQMRALGTAREDLTLVENSLKELANIRQQDMARIITQLETAASSPSDSAAPLAGALTDQKVVAARLRSLVARLQLRQQELALAQRAKELAARQAANHPRTADLKPDTPSSNSDRVLADAEQQGIREEALSLAEQIQRLRADPQMTPSPTLDRLSQPANLEGLRSAANAAATQLKAGDFPGAYAQQALLFDRLSRLSELGRRTPEPAEAAKAAANAVKNLLQEQKALAAGIAKPDGKVGDKSEGKSDGKTDGKSEGKSDPKADAAKQAELAAKAEALRPQVDGVLAAAGSEIRQAAEAMRPDGEKPATAAQQAEATKRLEKASDLLNKQADKLAAAEAAKPPETPASQKVEADQLAGFAREALILQKTQEQLNASIAAPAPPPVAAVDRDQTDLVRRTAALQQQVLQAGHIAAASLGQAAVRMSEALSTANPAPTVQLASASRQTAAERLAEAVALLTASAKEQQAASALANAQAATTSAADSLAKADANLNKAAKGDPDAAKQAQQNLTQAQRSLQQAGQAGAQLPPATQQAMSQSWQATQQAQQQAQQGNNQAAQQAAQAAQAALKQAQAQLAQQAQQQQGQGQQSQNQNQPGSPDQQIASNQSPQTNTPGGLSQVDHNINVPLAGSGGDADATVAAKLSRAEREALAAARHQPIARAYTAQVEAYLDNLAEATDSR